MTDQDIYEEANRVFSAITNDLNEAFYKAKSGRLEFAWGHSGKLNAYACSDNPMGPEPKHRIIVAAELVCQIYKDIASYWGYIDSEIDNEIFEGWYKEFSEIDYLPAKFPLEARITNTFIAAITWVYFHELGHLSQEHGFFRDRLGGKRSSRISEMTDESGLENQSGEGPNVFHATELAADYFSVSICRLELMNHFKGEDLEEAIHFYTCGISCALYRFNVKKPYMLDEFPVGSHPMPIVRLENILPMIYEYFDSEPIRSYGDIKMSRRGLVYSCNRAASTVGLFWNREHMLYPNLVNDLLIQGILQRENLRLYMRVIIDTWDNIREEVMQLDRFAIQDSLLFFTDIFRTIVFGGKDDLDRLRKPNASEGESYNAKADPDTF
jgi:hypothetical protein